MCRDLCFTLDVAWVSLRDACMFIFIFIFADAKSFLSAQQIIRFKSTMLDSSYYLHVN